MFTANLSNVTSPPSQLQLGLRRT